MSGWPHRLRGISPRMTDLLLVAAVAAAMTLTISVAQEEDATRSPDALAYLLGLSVAALLFARRRQPLLVLIGSVGVLLLYYAINYPAFSPAVPLAAAAYSAAVAGYLPQAALLLGGTLLFGVSWQTIGEDDNVLSVLGTGALADAALLAAVLLLGVAVRNRRAWADEVRGRLERAERDRELEAERRVEQERLRIARDLHDVLAHTIAGINVQAGVAADLIDDAPGEARAPLRAIRAQSGEAMTELRATLGLLRDGPLDAPRAPAPGLEQLDRLVGMARDAGVRVGVSVVGTRRPLPAAVDLTAYRIVQESLTNVVRHAYASSATVVVRYAQATIELEVRDDGDAGANGTPSEGFGLLGMRERAAAVGGALLAGPGRGGGFGVYASLPTERSTG